MEQYALDQFDPRQVSLPAWHLVKGIKLSALQFRKPAFCVGDDVFQTSIDPIIFRKAQ